MKNIKMVELNKYNADNYKEIAFGVYLNKSTNKYCFCFEADEIKQYPLEDLLDQYRVNCTEYYGQEVEIDGIKKYIAEVETLSDSKLDLIKILNFSTIVDKEIINVLYKQSELLVVNYGNSNVIVNGKEIHIPIVGYRNDGNGMICFELKYPEARYKVMFTEGQNYEAQINNFDENKLKYILLRDGKAIMVYQETEEETKEIVFNQKGIEQIN